MPLTRNSSTARFLANFGANLLRTKRTERSNSSRYKFWHALTETVSLHRHDFCAADSGYAFDLLRESGPFDHDEQRFRRAVREVLVCISRSPKVVEIARSLARFVEEERDLRILELAVEALERRNKNQQLLTLAGDALRECDQVDELRRELQRI
jgi:hypothetical protein